MNAIKKCQQEIVNEISSMIMLSFPDQPLDKTSKQKININPYQDYWIVLFIKTDGKQE